MGSKVYNDDSNDKKNCFMCYLNADLYGVRNVFVVRVGTYELEMNTPACQHIEHIRICSCFSKQNSLPPQKKRLRNDFERCYNHICKLP